MNQPGVLVVERLVVIAKGNGSNGENGGNGEKVARSFIDRRWGRYYQSFANRKIASSLSVFLFLSFSLSFCCVANRHRLICRPLSDFLFRSKKSSRGRVRAGGKGGRHCHNRTVRHPAGR